MKNYLAIFFFTCTLALDAQVTPGAPEHTLVFDRPGIDLDTVPEIHHRSNRSLGDDQLIHFSFRSGGDYPVEIDSVFHHRDNFRWRESRFGSQQWPDVCLPGQWYEITFHTHGSASSGKYEFKLKNGTSVFFPVKGFAVPVGFASPLWYTGYPVVIDGEKGVRKQEMQNTSGEALWIDSVLIVSPGWSCLTSVPFLVQPGQKFDLSFEFDTRTDSMVGFTSSYASYGVFYRNSFGYARMFGASVTYSVCHGVVLETPEHKYFGQRKNGDELTSKFTVRNNGTQPFSLAKQKQPNVSFAKDTLLPGDTAIGAVTWTVAYADGAVRRELPIFYDFRNGRSMMYFHCAVGSGKKREYSVHPDSLIWVESYKYDYDTVYRSQWRIEQEVCCRNNSPVPIIIDRCSTGDGGSMAWGPKEPIMPGQEFRITFVQDLRSKVGPFNRTMTVQISGLDQPVMKFVTFQGFIVNDEMR